MTSPNLADIISSQISSVIPLLPSLHPSNSFDPSILPSLLDHTLLRADSTSVDIEVLCTEAMKYCFKTVCVNPCHVKLASRLVKHSSTKVITVIGFPLGANDTLVKVYEAKLATEHGAEEIDMVINIGHLKLKEYNLVYEDVKQVVDAVAPIPVKLILETALLTPEEIISGCIIGEQAGVKWVKTSTGFAGGAKIQDVLLMRQVVSENIGVKASGGIKTLTDSKNMIKAGAGRLGCSASVSIIGELTRQRPSSNY